MARREQSRQEEEIDSTNSCALWYRDSNGGAKFLIVESEEEASIRAKTLGVTVGKNSIIGIQHKDGRRIPASEIRHPTPRTRNNQLKPHEAPPEETSSIQVRNPFDDEMVEVKDAPEWMRQ